MKLIRTMLWVLLIAIALTLSVGFYFFDWTIDDITTWVLLGLVGMLAIALLGFLFVDLYLHANSDKDHLKKVGDKKDDSQESSAPKKVDVKVVAPAKAPAAKAKTKETSWGWRIIGILIILGVLLESGTAIRWILSKHWIEPQPHHIVASGSDTDFSITQVQLGPPKVLETAPTAAPSAPVECTQPAFTATATKTTRAEAVIPLHCRLIVDGLSADERNKRYDRSCQDRTGTWYDPGLNECVNDNGAGYQLKEDSEIESREVHFTYETIK